MLIISPLKGFICPKCEKLKEKIRKDFKMCDECFGKVEEEMLDFIKNNNNNYGFKNEGQLRENLKYF